MSMTPLGFCLRFYGLVVLWFVMLVACQEMTRRVPPPTQAVQYIPKVIERVVPCMRPPPKFEVIEWPDADKVGYRVLAASTVDRIKDALATERKYIDESWAACQDKTIEDQVWKEQR